MINKTLLLIVMFLLGCGYEKGDSRFLGVMNSGTKVAFIGDTGDGSNFQRVLNLIKKEKTDLTLVAGDTAYDGSDTTWDRKVRETIGPRDPAIIVAGNHDISDSDWGLVKKLATKRLDKSSQKIKCKGDYGERYKCELNNITMVFSSIGTIGSKKKHRVYIKESLKNSSSNNWKICVWHKNQKNMQVGDKGNSIGWGAYETCRKKGAIIVTGHEHSYSRTHLLSDMSQQTIADKSSEFTIEKGKTFAVVTGLGGMSIRPQQRKGNWWASIYTATQGATYGALFGTFYDDKAYFYFKNIKGEIIDRFTIHRK